MVSRLLVVVPLALSAWACSSARFSVTPVTDAGQRDALLAVVSELEGSWQGTGPGGKPAASEFAVTADGTAVRERMFPGTAHEMTNMYTLDGDSLLMTHYCASGNQPRMRATGIDGNRVVFRAAGVADLNSADEVYMGEMTLVIVDADHIEQHWRAFKGDAIDHEGVFELARTGTRTR